MASSLQTAQKALIGPKLLVVHITYSVLIGVSFLQLHSIVKWQALVPSGKLT